MPWRVLGAIGLFLLVLVATKSPTLGDTVVYSNNIVANWEQGPVGLQNSLWEFGHLLWGPLGWSLTRLSAPLLAATTDWTPNMQATFVLITINTLGSIATVVLWYLLILDVGGSPRLALALSVALACGHGFLLHTHSGTSYITGLACASGALFALRRERIALGALLYALSAMLWFPYVLLGLAFLLVAICSRDWDGPIGERLRSANFRNGARFVAYAGLCLALGYGTALWARQTSTLEGATAWVAESRHGMMQTIRAVRIVTGLPRSFLFLDRDGMLYKRFLFHDPFAPVGILDLVQASLWKILAFGLFSLALVYECWRKAGWSSLVIITAVGPVLFFAVVLFEPGSPERYLPIFPFLALGIAQALMDFWPAKRFTQWVLVVFLLCVIGNNGYALSRPRLVKDDAVAWGRVEEVRQRLSATSVLVIATNQDRLGEYVNRSPFGEVNRPWPMVLYDVLEVAAQRIQTWREGFAEQVLTTWARGGDIWISKRLWQAKPLPDWYWVEGESSLSWTEVPPFFAELQTDTEAGGSDGFLHLVQNDANRNRLLEIQRKSFAVQAGRTE